MMVICKKDVVLQYRTIRGINFRTISLSKINMLNLRAAYAIKQNYYVGLACKLIT